MWSRIGGVIRVVGILALVVAVIQLVQSNKAAETQNSAQATQIAVLERQLNVQSEMATLQASTSGAGPTASAAAARVAELESTAVALVTAQAEVKATLSPPVPSGSEQAERIGFNFTNRTPESLEGDTGAPDHIFIHMYPIPGPGFITGVTYLNDNELSHPEVSETITLLVLRPATRGWRVIHRVTLPDDDHPPTTKGITTLKLDSSLPVEKGDVFAHWQPGARPTGPIPLNGDSSSIDGLSVGKFGFISADIELGQNITDSGFTGSRDYFMNIIFEPTP